MRACGVTGDELTAFALGETNLEVHVEGCDECLRYLAELWSSIAPATLVSRVVRRVLGG